MQIICIHCGNGFVISAEHLGGMGRCPHCQTDIQLPSGEQEEERQGGLISWFDGSLSGMISLVFNMGLILLLALLTYGGGGLAGEGDDVLIGTLPSESLTSDQDNALTSESTAESDASETLDDALQLEDPSETTDDLAVESFLLSPTASGGSTGDFDIGNPSTVGGGAAGGSFAGEIQRFNAHGLDIVITFDSTGSMGGEIDVVKSQIKDIGGALLTLVPKARLSICTYRDVDDEYLVKGLPLTGDIQDVDVYLSDIRAGGGGDHPEGVEAGLRWAIENNTFRSRAKKIILVFGDAPPHDDKLKECLQLAGDFHAQGDGVVSTITCRHGSKMPEFVDIAQVGGGEAFLTTDKRQIMTEIMVLVFGSKFRGKVLEAFKLIGE